MTLFSGLRSARYSKNFRTLNRKKGLFVLCFLDLFNFNFSEMQTNQPVVSQSKMVFLKSACVQVA